MEVKGRDHAGMSKRLTVVEHVRHREQRTADRGDHFVAENRVPTAELEVDAALGQVGQVDLGIESWAGSQPLAKWLKAGTRLSSMLRRMWLNC